MLYTWKLYNAVYQLYFNNNKTLWNIAVHVALKTCPALKQNRCDLECAKLHGTAPSVTTVPAATLPCGQPSCRCRHVTEQAGPCQKPYLWALKPEFHTLLMFSEILLFLWYFPTILMTKNYTQSWAVQKQAVGRSGPRVLSLLTSALGCSPREQGHCLLRIHLWFK